MAWVCGPARGRAEWLLDREAGGSAATPAPRPPEPPVAVLPEELEPVLGGHPLQTSQHSQCQELWTPRALGFAFK